jgi:hypothetical protein
MQAEARVLLLCPRFATAVFGREELDPFLACMQMVRAIVHKIVQAINAAFYTTAPGDAPVIRDHPSK